MSCVTVVGVTSVESAGGRIADGLVIVEVLTGNVWTTPVIVTVGVVVSGNVVYEFTIFVHVFEWTGIAEARSPNGVVDALSFSLHIRFHLRLPVIAVVTFVSRGLFACLGFWSGAVFGLFHNGGVDFDNIDTGFADVSHAAVYKDLRFFSYADW